MATDSPIRQASIIVKETHTVANDGAEGSALNRALTPPAPAPHPDHAAHLTAGTGGSREDR